jgi:hypothetical protein
LGSDDRTKGGVEVGILVRADQSKLILGKSGSLAGVEEEAHTITDAKPLELPDLGVLGVPVTLGGERRNSIAAAHGYAECYTVPDTYLEASGVLRVQLRRALLFTAARSSL